MTTRTMTTTMTADKAIRGRGSGTVVGDTGGGAGLGHHVRCQDKTPAVILRQIRSSPPTSIAMTPDSWIHLSRHNLVSPVCSPNESWGAKESPVASYRVFHANNDVQDPRYTSMPSSRSEPLQPTQRRRS